MGNWLLEIIIFYISCHLPFEFSSPSMIIGSDGALSLSGCSFISASPLDVADTGLEGGLDPALEPDLTDTGREPSPSPCALGRREPSVAAASLAEAAEIAAEVGRVPDFEADGGRLVADVGLDAGLEVDAGRDPGAVPT